MQSTMQWYDFDHYCSVMYQIGKSLFTL